MPIRKRERLHVYTTSEGKEELEGTDFLPITITGGEYAARDKPDKQYPQDRAREKERERLRVLPAGEGKTEVGAARTWKAGCLQCVYEGDLVPDQHGPRGR